MTYNEIASTWLDVLLADDPTRQPSARCSLRFIGGIEQAD